MRSVESFPEMEYEFCVHYFPKVGPLACFLLCILLEMIANLGINLSDLMTVVMFWRGCFADWHCFMFWYFNVRFLCIRWDTNYVVMTVQNRTNSLLQFSPQKWNVYFLFWFSFVGNCEIDLEIKRYFCRAGVKSIQVKFNFFLLIFISLSHYFLIK